MVAKPHGNKLVYRVVKNKEEVLTEALELPCINVTYDVAAELENIARGVYSPLEGFMCQNDYVNVLNNMRLSNDIPWTIPITLDVSSDETKRFKEGDTVTLKYENKVVGIVNVEEIYSWDKREYAIKVFKTRDPNHPGVRKILNKRDSLIGGKVTLINELPTKFSNFLLWPYETRLLFKEKGWRTIVGFQTRNVPHLGHEYIQKAALTFVDGLLIHPLIGWKKPGDFKDEVIIAAYNVLLKHYAPREFIVFAVLRMEMRYAGPREAIHHAIVRKNFGCTHFIVGRDHAGVGNYYKPYEAWEIFDEFPDLGITPLFIRESYYCKKCGSMVNEKICPHRGEDKILISGSYIRKLIANRQIPPPYLMRKEVSEVVLSFKNPFVE